MKQLKHRYCRCRPLVVTFVCYEFSTLSCATKLAKVPHFCEKYCRDWKCSPAISPGDICSLISWHPSFWGCKRHQAARPDSLVLLCSAMPFRYLCQCYDARIWSFRHFALLKMERERRSLLCLFNLPSLSSTYQRLKGVKSASQLLAISVFFGVSSETAYR